jgi:hypothetical protein
MRNCDNGDAVLNDSIYDAVWKSMRPEREIAGQSATNRWIVADATDRVRYFVAEGVAKAGETVFIVPPRGSEFLGSFW